MAPQAARAAAAALALLAHLSLGPGAAAHAQAPPPPRVPSWTARAPNASLPYGGLSRLPNVSFAQVYRGSAALGLYTHVPMLDFYGSAFLAYWINAPVTEGNPTRILYSQSLDGVSWSPVDESCILFPNMTIAGGNVSIYYAGPAIHLRGRVYVTASRQQTELYPVEWLADMLLRRVDTERLHAFGPLFWATDKIPPGAEAASAIYGIATLDAMDAQTQADVRGSGLGNASAPLPCGSIAGEVTNKCEACAGGCLPQAAFRAFALNEHAHYSLAGGAGDVELLRSGYCVNATAAGHRLYASVRAAGGGAWSEPVETNIPDVCSNLNAGALPDGRRYLISNANAGARIRDPLTLALSLDGAAFSDAYAVISCTELPGSGCVDRGGNGGGPGVSYPQGVVISAPAALAGLWIVLSNNKEDLFVVRVPLGGW